MKDTVIIALPRFRQKAEELAAFLNADFREYTPSLFRTIFPDARRIVALMSVGIVVRQIAPLLTDKWTDPAVVVVSPDFRYAIPVLGGHHGANELAKELAGIGLHPVISTATESAGRDSAEKVAARSGTDIINRESTRLVNGALLDGDIPVYALEGPGIVIAGPDVSILLRKGEYSVGIGCRKGVETEEILGAIRMGMTDAGIREQEVLVYATTRKKWGEAGLAAAVSALSGNLIFLDEDSINAQPVASPSRATRLGLAGVAEPCALAVSKHRELVMKKRVYGRVTIAIAR